ncbi:MAG: Cna B-type domain-containing protein, partial [Tissierellia bacterium]|nr:Cna B-type domain-containing protein [Tissierellia bacterium]
MHGTIKITGNTLQVPDENKHAKSDIEKALNGEFKGEKVRFNNNNSYIMVSLDKDEDPNTISSSAAELKIPEGANVKQAYLVWGAANKTKGSEVFTHEKVASNNQPSIKFKSPVDENYRKIEANEFNILTNRLKDDYTAYADVTEVVKAGGSGYYWAADIPQVINGTDLYAGWSLIVVLEDKDEPLNHLSVYFGHHIIGDKEEAKLEIDGLQTPPQGDVKAKVGFVVWEGDLGRTGDQAMIKNKKGEFEALSDSLSPENNFFNSTVSENGNYIVNRIPAFNNNMSVDAKVINIDGKINNNTKEIEFKYTTGDENDWYYPTISTFEIEQYSPQIDVDKKISKVNDEGPGEAVKVGDIIEYEILFKNTGLDNAIDTVATDKLPAVLEYEKNSIEVIRFGKDDQYHSQTDEIDSDLAEYVENDKVIRVNIGNLEATTDPANQKDQYGIKFKAKVREDASVGSLINECKVICNGESGAKDVESSGEHEIKILKSFTVEKVWEGDENVTRPALNFTLYRKVEGGVEEAVPGGEVKDITKDLTTATWDNLDITDINGNKYIYSVKETVAQSDPLDENWVFGEMETHETGNPFIKNRVISENPENPEDPENPNEKLAKLTIKKVFKNEPNVAEVSMLREAKEPIAFTFKVTGPYGYEKEVILKAGEEVTLDKLYYGEYKVEETVTHGYTPSYDKESVNLTKAGPEGTIIVTNTNEPDDPNVPGVDPNPNILNITVSKEWVNGPKPDTAIELWRKGLELDGTPIDEKVAVDDGKFTANAETLSHTFKGLAKHDPSGREFEYYAKEPTVPENYNVEISGIVDNEIIVTNTYTIPTDGSFTVEKVWEGDENVTRPALNFTLYRKVEGGTEEEEAVPGAEVKDITATETTATWDNLEETDINGNKYIYSVKETVAQS